MPTKARHTPGPWRIRIEGTSTGRGPVVYTEGPYYDDNSEFEVADCGCSEYTGGKKRWKRTAEAGAIEANARLIAAGPDHAMFTRALLLHAIRWEFFLGSRTDGEICANGLRYSTELDEFGVPIITDIIRAAITEAEGRS